MIRNSAPAKRTSITKRTSRLVRPEQIFFDDPAVDRLMGVVMALATEHYVLHDRVRALEQQLARAGHVDPAAVAGNSAGAEIRSEHEDAAAFAEELLRPLLGLQQAAGATGRFSLRARRRRKGT